MHITRRFTREGQDPYVGIKFVPRTSRIVNPDGSVVFEMKNVLVPDSWSQVAVDILAQKYLRKAGIAKTLEAVPEPGVPGFLQKSRPAVGDPCTGQEADARQVFRRLAGCWTYWGWKGGYFSSEADAHAFFDETCFMLANQMAAPNSPQWFNTGLNWAYGIEGPPQGHWYVEPRTGTMTRSTSAYERPAPHACFIQSIADDLVNEGGIMDLWVREARIFKYGSGTGTNFSGLRGEGEPLSGGGKSSGLMSFLKIGDRAAGAIKSGGTTRRAAKMVVLDLDHPDIEEFVNWKVVEEQKVAELVAGLQAPAPASQRHLASLPQEGRRGEGEKGRRGERQVGRCAQTASVECNPAKNPKLRRAIAEAQADLVPIVYIERIMQLARQGFTAVHIEEYNTDWNSKAYYTVSGQNSNNSVRVDTRLHATPSRRTAPGTSTGGPKRKRPPRGTPAQAVQDAQGPRPVGPDLLCRLVLCRSGLAVRYHHQRMAHLPGGRKDQCVQSRARNTCSSTTPPAISHRSICSSSTTSPGSISTSTATAMPCASGR